VSFELILKKARKVERERERGRESIPFIETKTCIGVNPGGLGVATVVKYYTCLACTGSIFESGD